MQKKLRMSELSKKTGVAPGAIKYYLKEGLLPKPHKTSRNMAYYDPICIERLKLIRELQTKRFLPLRVIKSILETSDRTLSATELTTLLQIEGKIFRALEAAPKVSPEAERSLLKRLTIRPSELRQLIHLGLLTPFEKNSQRYYPADDILLLETLSKMRKSGFSANLGFQVEDLAYLQEFVELLVKKEVDLLASKVLGKRSAEKILQMILEGYAEVNALFGILHKKTILSEVERLKEASYAESRTSA